MANGREEYKFPDEKDAPEEEIQVEIEADGVEIEVVDDTPEADRGRTPMKEPPAEVTDEELAQYSEGVKKRIQHFSKGYHEERRQKEAAMREKEEAIRLAQQVVEENKRLKGSLSQGQQALLEQAKKVVQNELEQAKKNYKEAYERGDADGLIKAQEELTTAKMKADKVNNYKPPAVQQEKPVVQPASQPDTTPVDPKARAWQQANPWFGVDDEMTAVAVTVHRKLVESGVDTTSDAYYEKINSRMRQLFPDAFTSEKPSRKSTVVAPATRSTAPKKIVLTQSQVNLAKRLGVPVDAYARRVAELMRK